MRCPACRQPMAQTRREPGRFEVWTCEPCYRRLRWRRGEPYRGFLVLRDGAPIKRIEEPA